MCVKLHTEYKITRDPFCVQYEKNSPHLKFLHSRRGWQIPGMKWSTNWNQGPAAVGFEDPGDVLLMNHKLKAKRKGCKNMGEKFTRTYAFTHTHTLLKNPELFPTLVLITSLL